MGFQTGLGGIQEQPSTTVVFKDFTLREVPFKDLPGYFLSQKWAYASFVAAEATPAGGHEGIWVWDTLQYGNEWDYLLGKTNAFPFQDYIDYTIGYRAEVGELDGPAQLYFSPVDRKLHLLKAQAGIFRSGYSAHDPISKPWGGLY